MNHRRKLVRNENLMRYGEEPIPRRSDYLEWNYANELFAFGARLGESFDDKLLRQAFLDADFVREVRQKHIDLYGNSDECEEILSNVELSNEGETVLDSTLKYFIRSAFPYLPEEGVKAFVSYLTTEELLSEVSFHIGLKDLIKSKEYPPTRRTHATAFKAVIAALFKTAPERARRLVVDLVGVRGLDLQDISEVWPIEKPYEMLIRLLQNEGHDSSQVESRLLWSIGQNTIMSCFHVGIYLERKELIGRSPGESVEISEEMAARDALLRKFDLLVSKRSPISESQVNEMFSQKLSENGFREMVNVENVSLGEWSAEACTSKHVERLKLLQSLTELYDNDKVQLNDNTSSAEVRTS